MVVTNRKCEVQSVFESHASEIERQWFFMWLAEQLWVKSHEHLISLNMSECWEIKTVQSLFYFQHGDRPYDISLIN